MAALLLKGGAADGANRKARKADGRQLEVVVKTRAMSLAGLLLLSACGGDGPTEPSGPPPPPNVAGAYFGWPMWTTQFKRTHDGYSGSFRCQGRMTIVQAPGSSRFTGFAVVEEPTGDFLGASMCPPITFSLTGTVEAGGAISIVTRGPEPPVGPCPTPGETTFTGVVGGDNLSARGTVKVDCPGAGEGEYSFDQIISGHKY